jgi:thiol:disulfide interchange protein DsbC
MPGNPHGKECASCHTLTQQEATDLLKQKQVDVTVKSVKQSPAPGLFELLVAQNNRQGVLFVDYGKKHIIQGTVIDMATMQPVAAHMQELSQQEEIAPLDVRTIPVANALTIGNPKGSKRMYIFTDPDCPYCRKAHAELKKLAAMDPDVAITIMLMPLQMHPAAYDKSRAILESGSLKVLDKAFEGKELPKPAKTSSKKAIDENIAFASAHGIDGTPTLVMPDGSVKVGLHDAATLKDMLKKY